MTIALAVGTTAISTAFAWMAGWSIGGSVVDKTAWALIGVVAIVGAHLVPSLIRRASFGLRSFAWVVWAACMTYACFSHASYFLVVQQDAGLRRSELARTGDVHLSSTRELSAVLMEQSRVRSELAKIASAHCQECRWVRAKQVELTTRVAALEAEADESRRARRVDDATRDFQKSRQVNPVTARLSSVLGIDEDLATLVPALIFATLLDCLAMLYWLLLSRPATATTDIAGVTAPAVATIAAQAPFAPAVASPVVSSLMGADSRGEESPERQARATDAMVIEARKALANGTLERPTIAAVRGFFCCSQAAASEVAAALRAGFPSTMRKRGAAPRRRLTAQQ